MKKLEMLIPILSFIGALLGSYLSSLFDQNNWIDRHKIEQRKIIFDKRTDLIEKTSNILSETPRFESIEKQIKTSSYCKIMDVKLNNTDKNSICKNYIDDQKYFNDMSKEYYSMNAQWNSIASLDVIYFGPKTKAAIIAVSNESMWFSDEKKRQNIITAMSEELYKFDF
jgi:hypothetical protein